jgi:hypothetical protein
MRQDVGRIFPNGRNESVEDAAHARSCRRAVSRGPLTRTAESGHTPSATSYAATIYSAVGIAGCAPPQPSSCRSTRQNQSGG